MLNKIKEAFINEYNQRNLFGKALFIMMLISLVVLVTNFLFSYLYDFKLYPKMIIVSSILYLINWKITELRIIKE
ncbi:MAG: hypothetical protein ACOCP8_02260 [archaeon]